MASIFDRGNEAEGEVGKDVSKLEGLRFYKYW
jgi:hypothetical protein